MLATVRMVLALISFPIPCCWVTVDFIEGVYFLRVQDGRDNSEKRPGVGRGLGMVRLSPW